MKSLCLVGQGSMRRLVSLRVFGPVICRWDQWDPDPCPFDPYKACVDSTTAMSLVDKDFVEGGNERYLLCYFRERVLRGERETEY